MRKRRRILIDNKVQLALARRVVGYWMFCLLSASFMVLCWEVVIGTKGSAADTFGRTLGRYAPVLVATFVVVPMVLVDAIRWSNRFAGPLVRFRRSMRQLADGKSVAPLKFREGDYWQDLADSFNDLLDEPTRINSREQVAPDDPQVEKAAPDPLSLELAEAC
jgi:hypothetical protein